MLHIKTKRLGQGTKEGNLRNYYQEAFEIGRA
jgi:hypothetical protein